MVLQVLLSLLMILVSIISVGSSTAIIILFSVSVDMTSSGSWCDDEQILPELGTNIAFRETCENIATLLM